MKRYKDKLENHIGEKYNHLTITGVDRERMKNSKHKDSFVFADCDCGVCGRSYNYNKIKRGETQSCGHLKFSKKGQRKYNKIEHFDTYGIIYTETNSYLFDLEDEQYLLDKWWYTDCYGYLKHCYVENGTNHYVLFHRLIMHAKENEDVDHISKDKTDNRKTNLRLCTRIENNYNRPKKITNTSGVIGVYKKGKKWVAKIGYKYKTINLGVYETIDQAIRARLKGELKYYGEFSPQKELFSKYNIQED